MCCCNVMIVMMCISIQRKTYRKEAVSAPSSDNSNSTEATFPAASRAEANKRTFIRIGILYYIAAA